MRTINEITGRATTIIKETAPMLSEDTDKAEKVRDHLVLSLIKYFECNYQEATLPKKAISIFEIRKKVAVLMPKDKNHSSLYNFISEYFLKNVKVFYYDVITTDDILGECIESKCNIRINTGCDSYFFELNIESWENYLMFSDKVINKISRALFIYIITNNFLPNYDLKEYNGKLSYIDYTLNMDEAREHYNNNKNTRYL